MGGGGAGGRGGKKNDRNVDSWPIYIFRQVRILHRFSLMIAVLVRKQDDVRMSNLYFFSSNFSPLGKTVVF